MTADNLRRGVLITITVYETTPSNFNATSDWLVGALKQSPKRAKNANVITIVLRGDDEGGGKIGEDTVVKIGNDVTAELRRLADSEVGQEVIGA
jgi:hypothetical protein